MFIDLPPPPAIRVVHYALLLKISVSDPSETIEYKDIRRGKCDIKSDKIYIRRLDITLSRACCESRFDDLSIELE